MQKRHLIKNKFFDPRLQILFTACVCEIVNTMVYGKSSKYVRYSSCKQCKREKQQKSIVITNDKGGDGLAAITPKKLTQMKFAARLYVHNNNLADVDLRLVAISTTGDPPTTSEVIFIE